MEEWDRNAVAENQRGNVGNLGGNTKNVGNKGHDEKHENFKTL